jgi:hypothetical protein
MKNLIKISLILLIFNFSVSWSQVALDSLLPVRGICMGVPSPEKLDEFVSFIKNELAPNKVNTLILMVDYNYQYECYPELRSTVALSRKQVKQIVQAAKENHITLIPQINLLGHQSWELTPGKLLEKFPQFDETPWIKFPEKYEWPNQDRLYCKSYCPLYPGLHQVVFALVDEIVDVFESGAFHAGMDEVFYIGEDQCPRCHGKDKARLFADEVRAIRDHLASKGKELWIWGDRLLDGSSTGLGEWEASMNNTWRAVDMIPADVVICDWHYENAEPTPAYFALKGLRVAACPWRITEVGLAELNQMLKYRENSNPVLKDKFRGIIQTIWNNTDQFLVNYDKPVTDKKDGSVDCLKALMKNWNSLR